MLAGVSAGVIGVDGKGLVTIVNPSTEALLSAPKGDLVGRPVTESFAPTGNRERVARYGRVGTSRSSCKPSTRAPSRAARPASARKVLTAAAASAASSTRSNSRSSAGVAL